FLIRGAMTSFMQMDARLENVSRTLGASPISTFFRVSLPLAAPGIFSGFILTWARAVSETGSIMVIAYRPLTVGTLTFDVFTQYGLEEATPVAVLLVLTCLWAFIVLRWMKSYMTVLGMRRLRRQVRGIADSGTVVAQARGVLD
ncbi:MAG: ABC transporter permease subunit, partial [Armatimonadetes bacterium]|nr:ABC transporter permease subunit [Armatimonadota bacterium]